MSPKTTTMLHSKDINKIAELKNGFTPRWLEPDFILSSFKSLCKALHNFFKESKQLLELGRSQSNDFDAQIADTTITMIQHILLTLQFRLEHYETKEALFRDLRERIIQSRLDERLWGLFIELVRIIHVLFVEIDEMEIWEKMLSDERAFKIPGKLLSEVSKQKSAA